MAVTLYVFGYVTSVGLLLERFESSYLEIPKKLIHRKISPSCMAISLSPRSNPNEGRVGGHRRLSFQQW